VREKEREKERERERERERKRERENEDVVKESDRLINYSNVVECA